jgi:murein DD-endopeptidase MepM/ murein hydrolase activator NlpD
MPDQTLMAALIAAALGGAEPVLPEPPPFTRYPDEAYPIVSQFGSWKGIGGGRREAPNEGVDVIARVRTPVHAAAYGVVRRVAVERERGRVVEIETTGTPSARWATPDRCRGESPFSISSCGGRTAGR